MEYWLCWLLPLGVVAVVFIPLALAWGSGRAVMLSFIIALLAVGGALCTFGYSIDNTAYYM
ncbi:hypothetical protein XU06_29260 [Rhodococcus erythropolis]|uniref:hypothetical protein n=1 Tax=Rhodococcus erythropolis TaxID=1833 RepID=UPI00061B68A2|nr:MULTISPECIES: hypothetical protein [Rhodococcus erythropolis group]AKE00296.1 hypothetical protein XU06_29260 [Rhodococcus erythropolis]MCD2107500.1 hypothetical protein [Rhodococcus qingshengii]MCZ4526803.1 hypothetical protein [Rhodococcus erythropolis]OXM23306.1 hypothetical protein CBI33_07850 [Rhodococcus erythropolis]